MSEQDNIKNVLDTEESVDIDKEVTETINLLVNEAEEAVEDELNKENKQAPTKVKRHINPIIFWGIMAVLGLIFVAIFKTMPMFPFRWFLIALFVVLAIIIGMFFATNKIKKVPQKYVVRGVNIVLSIIFLVLSILMPYIKSKITSTIDSGNKEEKKETIQVNLYVMNDDYMNAHSDIFTDGPYKAKSYSSPEEELLAYKDATFISHMGVDANNQRIAINAVKEVFNSQQINMIDGESIQAAADALYNNEGQVMFLSETNISMLTSIEEYENFEKDTRIIYTVDVELDNPIIPSSTELTSEPFAVFFGGNDEYGGLKLQGKTDVDIVVVVNPKTHQMLMVSFPRDSYVPNPQAGGYADKLTHLGVGGIDNTLTSLSDLLGIDINNYVLINFSTFKTIINVFDGVDVDNPYEFSFWDDPNYHFPEGRIHLTGDSALRYVRERKTLPDGDFGRNMHQQIVMKAIIEKLASTAIITKFDALMTEMQGTFLTNISNEGIFSLCQYQLDKNIKWNIVNYRIEGGVGMAYCAWAPGQPLSVVYPSSDQLTFVAEEIQKLVNGEILEQQEIPAPYGQLSVAEVAAPPADQTIVEDPEDTTTIVTPEPTAAPTAVPEPTVAPTTVPEPTVAPTPTPTPTPVPTPEPTPEPTPVPTPTPEPSTEPPTQPAG